MTYNQPYNPFVACKKDGTRDQRWITRAERIHELWGLDLATDNHPAPRFRRTEGKSIGTRAMQYLDALAERFPNRGRAVYNALDQISLARVARLDAAPMTQGRRIYRYITEGDITQLFGTTSSETIYALGNFPDADADAVDNADAEEDTDAEEEEGSDHVDDGDSHEQEEDQERVDETPRKKRKKHVGEHGKAREAGVAEAVSARRIAHSSKVQPLFPPSIDEGDSSDSMAQRRPVRERQHPHRSEGQWPPVPKLTSHFAPLAPIPLPDISESDYAEYTKSIEGKTQEVLHRAEETGVPPDRALEISKRFGLRAYKYMAQAIQETATEMEYYSNEARARLLAHGRRIGIPTEKAVELVEKYNRQVEADRAKREQETLEEMEGLGEMERPEELEGLEEIEEMEGLEEIEEMGGLETMEEMGAPQGALQETRMQRTGVPDLEQEVDTEAGSSSHGPPSTQQSSRAGGSVQDPLSPAPGLLSPPPHTPQCPPRSSPSADQPMIIGLTPSSAAVDPLTDQQRREDEVTALQLDFFGLEGGDDLAADVGAWREAVAQVAARES